MLQDLPKDLLDKKLIEQYQFEAINPIAKGQIISVFYELRTLLYLGVMLFTAGAGILIYQNIGDIGHLLCIIVLMILTVACFTYVVLKGSPYSSGKVNPPSPYFDYVLLLGCLLFVAVLGYLQFRYAILDNHLSLYTLLSALIFFTCAYRFDHIGVLSLGVTALASFFGISTSPQNWYSSSFLSMESGLHIIGIAFSAGLLLVAVILDRIDVKKHFTFTYLNFCSLIFFTTTTTALFNESLEIIYAPLLFAGCVAAFWYATRTKTFLFLLYAFVFGYIGITYVLAITLLKTAEEFWLFYLLLSCGGFVYFIISSRRYYNRK